MDAPELIGEIQDWAVEAGTRRVDRPWCLLGLTSPFTAKDIALHFDRSELVAEYEKRYNEGDPLKKKAHSFLQTEINLVYSAHKAFVARHRTRLQCYRDDAAQKAFHCRRNISKAFTRFTVTQARAEQG